MSKGVLTSKPTGEEAWVPKALENALIAFEAKGVPISKSKLISLLLADGLESYREGAEAELAENVPVNKGDEDVSGGLRISIRFKKKDRWVYEMIAALAGNKQDMGFKTSFSAEAVRIMKNSLADTFAGREIDLKILEKKDAISEK